jgi:hypothetical protein
MSPLSSRFVPVSGSVTAVLWDARAAGEERVAPLKLANAARSRHVKARESTSFNFMDMHLIE